MNPTDIAVVVVYMIVGFTGLQILTWVVRRWLKLDSTEREQILQAQMNKLSDKVEDYEEEIEHLKKQVKIMVEKYEEAVGRLVKLQEQYDVSVESNRQLREQLNNLSSGYLMRDNRPNKILLVLIGSGDVGLSLDLATLRAVRTETGMEIQEISDATPEKLKRALDRARMRQDHIYLHMAIKTDADGYQIGTDIVDATWLSSILNGVLVLVVAGTESDQIGDFLGVVPYVITMSGSLSHHDAAMFSRSFWTEIGRGIGPSLALRRALDRQSGTVRERVVSHWEM